MSKRDWLRECNDQNVPTPEFTNIFCIRCRNLECSRAGYSGSLFADRVSTQVERLLTNPLFADLSLPQYAKIHAQDFPDAVRQALRIEIANKRKDWTLPPEDLNIEEAQRELVGSATPQPVKKAEEPASRIGIQLQVDDDSEGGEDIIPILDDADEPVVPKDKPLQPVVLNKTNTAFPVGGVMLDGSRPTAQTIKQAAPRVVVDPWAVPTPVENVVPVGAKIRLGFASADANEGKK